MAVGDRRSGAAAPLSPARPTLIR